MDHSTHTRLSPADLTDDMLDGTAIYDPMDEKVGKVSHLHGTGHMAHVIVDVGTFLGMGGKSVSLAVSSLTFMRDADGVVHATTGMTKDQIEALPEHHHG